ncbi:hypothetical protein VZ95_20800 [Elstera litoralis]|uniref:Solute-binding protein family 3/N-terminal domain-containing protein n=2 Tax=Elstera litoralis TaxID=552518 RepID=A0A0F3IHQ3_9PROT|nr:hypothetical protein VZ95_20800 [Elstera litoralis]
MIGFDVQLIEALGKESGCEIKFVGRAWSRLLKEVETGETQLAMGATKTAEREAYARFTQFYRMERLGVLVQKNKAQELKATSLKELIALPGAKIGAVTDWEYGDDYETLKKSPQFSEWVELSVRDEVNLRKLEAGRLKAMLVDLASAHVLVEELKMGGAVETHPLILSQADIHFMVSKAGVSEDIYKTPQYCRRNDEKIARGSGDLSSI